MQWSKDAFLRAYRQGVPVDTAIRCTLIYMLTRWLWISANRHFSQSGSQILTTLLYELFGGIVFFFVLVGTRPLLQKLRQLLRR